MKLFLDHVHNSSYHFLIQQPTTTLTAENGKNMTDNAEIISLDQLDQVKRDFAGRGETLSGWARKNGFMPRHVYDLLNGRTSGKSGESRRIAALLGLRDGEKPVNQEAKLNKTHCSFCGKKLSEDWLLAWQFPDGQKFQLCTDCAASLLKQMQKKKEEKNAYPVQ